MSDPLVKTADKSFEVAGFGHDVVEAEAFSRALPDISVIERLIVSAQRRLNDFLKQLTERRDKDSICGVAGTFFDSSAEPKTPHFWPEMKTRRGCGALWPRYPLST